MDGADALANGFAVPGGGMSEPSSGSGRTLGRQAAASGGGSRTVTHGSATTGTAGSRGPASLPHIGKLSVFLV